MWHAAERWLQRLHESTLHVQAERRSPTAVDCDRCAASQGDDGACSDATDHGLDITDHAAQDRTDCESDVECRSVSNASPPPDTATETAAVAAGASAGGPGGGGHRRRRTAFTSDQLLELEKEFHSKKYLSLTERSMIARQLRLSEVQVSAPRQFTFFFH